ncbi:MAG TPA: choice-of-anchor Q domain-containing protein, partial [Solirubrobacteraceae bacterium]|nr:choice-of-anchor Q domain-containing protein [Solirubrobacteraceae bacterium]
GGTAAVATGGAPGPGSPAGAAGPTDPGVAGPAGEGGGLTSRAAPTDLPLTATLAAGNTPDNCANVTDGGHNLSFPDATCGGVNADPRLAPLSANGSATLTHALAPGSAAIDRIPAEGAGCAPIDQRGVKRPAGAACDIGAHEVAPPGAVTGPATGVTDTAARIAGAATPNGSPTTYRFEYGTGTGYGTSTPAASAGRGDDAVPVSAELSGLAPATTYHYRLVATNADGTRAGADQTFTTAALPLPGTPPGAGPGPPTTPALDVTPPAFLSASVSPRRFAVRNGTTFLYAVSEPARVAFTIQRALSGRVAGGRCRKPSRLNRGARKCTRWVTVGGFAQQSDGTPTRRRLSGRLGGRRLRPGRYRAVLVATDAAGNRSAPRRLRFTVTRRA